MKEEGLEEVRTQKKNIEETVPAGSWQLEEEGRSAFTMTVSSASVGIIITRIIHACRGGTHQNDDRCASRSCRVAEACDGAWA